MSPFPVRNILCAVKRAVGVAGEERKPIGARRVARASQDKVVRCAAHVRPHDSCATKRRVGLREYLGALYP